tara:strand:+ start:1760 stop:2086 length:327 start_codon:yes stop_codon:yes gene_type:complete
MSEEVRIIEGTIGKPKNPFTESEAKDCVVQELLKQETGSSCVWKVIARDTNGIIYPLLIKGLSADIGKADLKTAIINQLKLTNKITPVSTTSSKLDEDDNMGIGETLA